MNMNSGKSLGSVLLAAAALLSLASAATAAEAEAFAGKALRRDVRDAQGNRFAVTLRPPAGRVADARLFDVFEVSAGDSSTSFESESNASREAPDVSGYVLEVEPLSVAATCSSKITVKNSPVTLGAGKSFSVTASAPPLFVSVTSFPKSGNVDAYVLNGSTPCGSSKKGTGQLDNASCVSSTCTGSSILIGQIKNASSSASAQYVGAINIVLSN
jgi:hypothetical protein